MAPLLKLVLAAWSLISLAHARRVPADAVRLSDIRALTFHSGRKTTGRRVSPIPQLQCVGGSARNLFEPDTIRCTASGYSYSTEDIEWTCTASLPPEFKLGSTDVVCEGYENSKDEYVLKGSCGLEYRLVLTELGEEKYSYGARFKEFWGGGSKGGRRHGNEDSWAGTLFWLVFAAVVLWMIYSAYFRNPRRRAAGRTGGGGGGWWGGGDDTDPPPPYSRQPPPKPRPAGSSWNAFGGNPYQGQGWRPGFWTGAATGAAASYLFGGNRQERPPRRTGGWGGRGGGGYGYNDPGEGSSTGMRSGGGSQTYSSTRYTSTGFGGTRRR